MSQRLAFLGDIHANLPALRACLSDLDGEGITDVACLGDIVMRGAQPEECVSEVRNRGWTCVAGNTDITVAGPDEPVEDHEPGSRWWTRNRLTRGSLEYLASLPIVRSLRMDTARIVLLHGDRLESGERIEEGVPDEMLLELAHRLQADCVVSGHTHRPFAQQVNGCLFVNPGSVGESRDQDRRPSWAWVELRNGRLVAHLQRVDAPLARVRP